MAGRTLAGELIDAELSDAELTAAQTRAREVAASERSAAPWSFSLAVPKDDAEVRRLLRETPMDGAIRLALECEPSAARAAAVMGDETQTLVAYSAGEESLVAVAVRAVYTAYANGAETRVAYLNHLRVRADQRGSPRLVARGFEHLRSWHEEDARTPLCFASVMVDNAPALRLLTSGALRMPRHRSLGSFVTLVLSTRGGRRPVERLRIRAATQADLPAIARLLQEEYRRFQLAPRWTVRDLESETRTPGLTPEDFLLAFDPHAGEEPLGCLALWDQRDFKQTVARGYAPWLGLARPAWNALASVTRAPRLPAPGAALRQAFLSHLALRGGAGAGAAGVLEALVTAGRAAAAARGIELVALGLAAEHPLLPALRRHYRHRALEARLLAFYWPGGEAAARALDGRLPHVEIATL